MTHGGPARASRRARRGILTAIVVASAALVGVAVLILIDSLQNDPRLATVDDDSGRPTTTENDKPTIPQPPSRDGQGRRAPGTPGTPLGPADGVVPEGTTIFDDELPAVANLDPELRDALRQAATAASADGIEFVVNSGWRSPKYQNQLLRDAIAKYGSEEEAARWVATPETSPHVSGDAIDLGPTNATTWLSRHGAAYGLCQIYHNEPWHYELRTEAIDEGCPPRYADPTQDPRMHQ